jgi:hypothetical protein
MLFYPTQKNIHTFDSFGEAGVVKPLPIKHTIRKSSDEGREADT